MFWLDGVGAPGMLMVLCMLPVQLSGPSGMPLTALSDAQHLFPKCTGWAGSVNLAVARGVCPPRAGGGVLTIEPDDRMRNRGWGAGGATLDRGIVRSRNPWKPGRRGGTSQDEPMLAASLAAFQKSVACAP